LFLDDQGGAAAADAGEWGVKKVVTQLLGFCVSWDWTCCCLSLTCVIGSSKHLNNGLEL
jgi:hypothetical protein